MGYEQLNKYAGWKPGTVPDEVVEEIAEQVAENSGDCREALEKLLKAGRKAEQEGKLELGLSDI